MDEFASEFENIEGYRVALVGTRTIEGPVHPLVLAFLWK